MFELTIKKGDNSIYWVEQFNTNAEALKWIQIEQTRPYWKTEYTYEIVDHSPPPPSQQDIDNEIARKQALGALRTRIKVLANQNDLTAAEVKEAIMKFIKFMVLRGDVT